MGVRRQSREVALQVLFQREFANDMNHQQALENFRTSFSFSVEVWDYAEKILETFIANENPINSIIDSHSENWSSQRMPLVDLNILRIAVCEIKFLGAEIPPKVAVNEALEISKKYGGPDSHTFVNGILGPLIEAGAE